MIELHGITWNHPRGYEPLRATSEVFTKENPDVIIKWDVRSLKEFGDVPVEDLIGRYDLIAIDHPYMGQADANNLLLNLKEKIPAEVYNELLSQSVGPSFKSYNYNNKLYALPIDASALVSAYRKDVLSSIGLVKVPETRSDLLDFYKKLPSDTSVAWALCPTDFWCVFLTLCAQEGGRNFIQDYSVNDSIGSKALDEIKLHLEFIHPEAMNWNPIQILDRMGESDDIVYCPYLFGYTNYSRKGYCKSLIHFTNSPVNPSNNISTILGGAGLAISAHCKEINTAVKFATYVASPEIQEGVYTQEAGQPGNLMAWSSEKNNRLCSNYFTNTLKTMENAYVRPQHPGWNTFQEQGAGLLHEGVLRNIDSSILMKQLNELYKSIENHE